MSKIFTKVVQATMFSIDIITALIHSLLIACMMIFFVLILPFALYYVILTDANEERKKR